MTRLFAFVAIFLPFLAIQAVADNLNNRPLVVVVRKNHVAKRARSRPPRARHPGSPLQQLRATRCISAVGPRRLEQSGIPDAGVPRGGMEDAQRRRKTTRSVQSHVPDSLYNCNRVRTRLPMFAGETVFSSTKMIPPWRRPSSAQGLSSTGIVLRSYVTSVSAWAAASSKHVASSCPRNTPSSHSAIE